MKKPSFPLSGSLLIVILILLFVPVLLILSQAFWGEGSFSLDSFKLVLSKPYYGRLLWFTLIQALVSSLLSIIIALPVVAFFVHFQFPFKKTLLSMTTLSFILPPILVVLSFVIFWGNKGTVNTLFMTFFHLETPPFKVLYSFKAIILAHIFYNIPLALRFIYGQWSTLPQSQYEAAISQGTNKRQLFQKIIAPQIMPSIGSSFLIIFLYCFMSFAIILVLGGGPKYSTLEVEVYRLIKFNLDFSTGGALAMGETLICLILVSTYLRLEKKRGEDFLIGSKPVVPHKIGSKGKGLLLLFLLFWGFFFGGPLISLIIHSFGQKASRSAEAGFSLRWYKELLTLKGGGSPVSLRAVGNSLYFALCTTFFATILGTWAAFVVNRKKALFPHLTEVLILLPMGISSIILALGFLFLSSRFSTDLGDLAVITAHTFIALPFVYRGVGTSLGQIDNSLRESALIQGAREIQSLIYIELPLLKKTILGGALFSFAISMGEVNAVLILASPQRITIPIAIYRLIGSYNYHGASAMGTLLIILSLIAFILLNRLDREEC